MRGARLSNPAGVVIEGDGLAIGASLSCREGFSAEGEIRLTGARLGGGLDMNGVQLRNPGGRVLSADQITVGASVLCRGGFTARGEISVRSARVAGDIDLSDASLVNQDAPVLDAEHLDVGGSMLCLVLSFTGAHLTNPDLSHAHIERLDDELTCWPKPAWACPGGLPCQPLRDLSRSAEPPR